MSSMSQKMYMSEMSFYVSIVSLSQKLVLTVGYYILSMVYSTNFRICYCFVAWIPPVNINKKFEAVYGCPVMSDLNPYRSALLGDNKNLNKQGKGFFGKLSGAVTFW